MENIVVKELWFYWLYLQVHIILIEDNIYGIIIISYFILKAFKDELALLIFIFSDSVFGFEFVVLHWFWVIEVDIFGVEHMGTKI